MLIKGKGSIFDSDAEAIVNAVNCVGVMGAGLAKAFKDKYPHMNEQYVVKCRNGMLKPGKLDIYVVDSSPKYIINFPTKDHWKFPSKLDYIYTGITELLIAVHDWKIKSVAIPALGCGLGGLDWAEVRPILEKLNIFWPDINWIIYDPQ